MTRRELISYVAGLPQDSATFRSVHGAAADWDPTMHRLTDIAEMLNVANWQRAGRGPAPRPIDRPV